MERRNRVCGVPVGDLKRMGESGCVMFPWKLMERKELIKVIEKQQEEIDRLKGELKNKEKISLEENKEEQYKPDTAIVMVVSGVFSVLLFLAIVMACKVVKVLM